MTPIPRPDDRPPRQPRRNRTMARPHRTLPHLATKEPPRLELGLVATPTANHPATLINQPTMRDTPNTTRRIARSPTSSENDRRRACRSRLTRLVASRPRCSSRPKGSAHTSHREPRRNEPGCFTPHRPLSRSCSSMDAQASRCPAGARSRRR